MDSYLPIFIIDPENNPFYNGKFPHLKKGFDLKKVNQHIRGLFTANGPIQQLPNYQMTIKTFFFLIIYYLSIRLFFK